MLHQMCSQIDCNLKVHVKKQLQNVDWNFVGVTITSHEKSVLSFFLLYSSNLFKIQMCHEMLGGWLLRKTKIQRHFVISYIIVSYLECLYLLSHTRARATYTDLLRIQWRLNSHFE